MRIAASRHSLWDWLLDVRCSDAFDYENYHPKYAIHVGYLFVFILSAWMLLSTNILLEQYIKLITMDLLCIKFAFQTKHAGVFQAQQLILLAMFGTMDETHGSCMAVHCEIIDLNDNWS